MKLIPLTQGQFAQVDDEDFEWLNAWKWKTHKVKNTFYAERAIRIGRKTKTIMMHRLILGLHNTWYAISDHKDRNGLNNQRANLRHCSSSENNANRKIGNQVSKYKGVAWEKARKKWIVRPMKHGKSFWVERFDNEIDAAKAYNKIAKELHGEFALLNDV